MVHKVNKRACSTAIRAKSKLICYHCAISSWPQPSANKNFSMMRDIIGVTEISLKSDIVEGVDNLGTGVIIAVNHWRGKVPVNKV
jgi:hypothetical protein